MPGLKANSIPTHMTMCNPQRKYRDAQQHGVDYPYERKLLTGKPLIYCCFPPRFTSIEFSYYFSLIIILFYVDCKHEDVQLIKLN